MADSISQSSPDQRDDVRRKSQIVARVTTAMPVGGREIAGDMVDLSTPNCACASWEGPLSFIGGHHHQCERYDVLSERRRWEAILRGLLAEIDGGVSNGPFYRTALKATGGAA